MLPNRKYTGTEPVSADGRQGDLGQAVLLTFGPHDIKGLKHRWRNGRRVDSGSSARKAWKLESSLGTFSFSAPRVHSGSQERFTLSPPPTVELSGRSSRKAFRGGAIDIDTERSAQALSRPALPGEVYEARPAALVQFAGTTTRPRQAPARRREGSIFLSAASKWPAQMLSGSCRAGLCTKVASRLARTFTDRHEPQ